MALSALFSLLFLIICALGPQKADAVASDVFRIVRQPLESEPTTFTKDDLTTHFSEVCQDINTGIGQSPAGDLWTELTPSAIILSPNYGNRPSQVMASGFVPYVVKRDLHKVKACANFLQSKLQLEDDDEGLIDDLNLFYEDSYSKSQFTAFFDFDHFEREGYFPLTVEETTDSIDYCTTLSLGDGENADSKIRLMTAVFDNKVVDNNPPKEELEEQMRSIPDFYALYLQLGEEYGRNNYVDALSFGKPEDASDDYCTVNYHLFTLEGLVQYLPDKLLTEYWGNIVDSETVDTVINYYQSISKDAVQYLDIAGNNDFLDTFIEEGFGTFEVLCDHILTTLDPTEFEQKTVVFAGDNNEAKTQAEAKKDLILPELLTQNIAALKDETETELANAESALVAKMTKADEEYFIAQFASSRFRAEMVAKQADMAAETPSTWPTSDYTDAAAFTTAYDAATSTAELKTEIAKFGETILEGFIKEKFTAKEIILLLSLDSYSSSVLSADVVNNYLEDFTSETLNDAFLTFCTDKQTYGCITVDDVAKVFTGDTAGAAGDFTLANTADYRTKMALTGLTDNIFDKDVTAVAATVTKTDVEEDLKAALDKLIETKATDAATITFLKQVVADFERPHKIGDAVGVAANAATATYITDESRMALLALQYTADDNKWLSVAADATVTDTHYQEMLQLGGGCVARKDNANGDAVAAILDTFSYVGPTGVRMLKSDPASELEFQEVLVYIGDDLVKLIEAYKTKKDQPPGTFKNSDFFKTTNEIYCNLLNGDRALDLRNSLKELTNDSLIALTATYFDHVEEAGRGNPTEGELRNELLDHPMFDVEKVEADDTAHNEITYRNIIDLGFGKDKKIKEEAQGEISLGGSPFINASADGTTAEMCLPITTVDTTNVTPSLSVLNVDVENSFKDFTSVVVEQGELEVGNIDITVTENDPVITNTCYEVEFTGEYTAVPNVFAYLSYTVRSHTKQELPLYVYVNSVTEEGAYICVGHGRKALNGDKITGTPKIKYLVLSPIVTKVITEDDPDTEDVNEYEDTFFENKTKTISLHIKDTKPNYTEKGLENIKQQALEFMKFFAVKVIPETDPPPQNNPTQPETSDTGLSRIQYEHLTSELNLVFQFDDITEHIQGILDEMAKYFYVNTKTRYSTVQKDGLDSNGIPYTSQPIKTVDKPTIESTVSYVPGETGLVPETLVLSGNLSVEELKIADDYTTQDPNAKFDGFLDAIKGIYHDYAKIDVYVGSNECGSNALVYDECSATCGDYAVGSQTVSIHKADVCAAVYPEVSPVECGIGPCGEAAPIQTGNNESFVVSTTTTTTTTTTQESDIDPVNGDPVNGDPVNGDPVNGDPVNGDPVNGDPAGGDPAGGDPAGGDPAGGDPAEESSGGLSGGAIAGIVVGVVAVVGGAGGAFYYFRIRKK